VPSSTARAWASRPALASGAVTSMLVVTFPFPALVHPAAQATSGSPNILVRMRAFPCRGEYTVRPVVAIVRSTRTKPGSGQSAGQRVDGVHDQPGTGRVLTRGNERPRWM
jgi:hypothetical protein